MTSDDLADDRPERTRQLTWADPMATAVGMRGRTGLEFLQALQAGEFPPPPILALVGGRLISATEGTVVFACDPQESHYNPIGSVHGGIIATLLDSATGCAVQSTLPLDVGYTSLDLSVKYLRAVRLDTGPITATGTVIHGGRCTALAQAELRDSTGKLLATATSSCLILPLP